MLRKLLFVFITVIIFSLSLVVWIVVRPQDLINEQNLSKVSRYLNSHHLLKISWKYLSIHIDSKTALKKEWQLQIKDVCLETRDKSLSGCFEDITADFVSIVRLHLPLISEVKNIVLKAHKLDLKESANQTLQKKNSAAKVSGKIFDKITGPQTQIGSINIQIDKLNFYSKKKIFSLSFIFSHQRIGDLGKLKLAARARTGGVEVKAAKMKLQGTYFLSQGINSLSTDGFIQARLSKLKVHILLKTTSLPFSGFHGNFNYNLTFPEGNTRGTLSLYLDRSKTISAKLNSSGSWKDVNFSFSKPCEISSEKMESLKFSCLISPRYRFPQPVTQAFEKTGIEPKLAVSVDLKRTEGPQDLWNGALQAKLSTAADNKLLHLDTLVQVTLKDFHLSSSLQNLKIHYSFLIENRDFQGLVTALKETPFVPPAPINSFKGTVLCQSANDLDLNKMQFPFHCRSDLAARNDALKSDFSGELGFSLKQINTQNFLNLTIALSDVRLSLPRFILQAPPTVFPDSRIGLFSQIQRKSPESFKYLVNIMTKQNHPLYLFSNFAEAPVPLDLNIHAASDAAVYGSLKFKTFPLKIFNRRAHVKFFNITLNAFDSGDDLVKGEFSVSYADYKIKIFVDGTTKEPILSFDSSPPLDHDQIISVLLFGKTLDQLDADGVGNVAATQAIISDRAMTLASMYFLSNTQIESISYNPESSMVVAKIKLKEGMSLNIGSSTGNLNEVGVNKHLGGPWYIYTTVRNPQQDNQATAAFLEWVLKY